MSSNTIKSTFMQKAQNGSNATTRNRKSDGINKRKKADFYSEENEADFERQEKREILADSFQQHAEFN